MEYRDKRPEAFSDRESIESRNRRTAVATSISLMLFLLMALIFAMLLVFFPHTMDEGDKTQMIVAT